MRQSQFNRLCNPERGWAFERVVDAGLEGFDHKTIPGTETRADCARLCLLEEDFDCRSAEYAIESKRCVLSREDRKTQPEAFRRDMAGVDYIENQCTKRKYRQGEKGVRQTEQMVCFAAKLPSLSGLMRIIGGGRASRLRTELKSRNERGKQLASGRKEGSCHLRKASAT